MIKDYKHEIILALLFIGFSIAFYFLYGILLPFILGLLLAFAVSPIISWIQKLVKNRDLATTLFLISITAITILFVVFFTQYINRDFKRLNQSFVLLASNNQDNLDKTAQKVKDYIGKLYDFDELESELKLQSDSLISSIKDLDFSELDTESIKAGFEKMTSVFKNDDEGKPEKKSGFGFIFMFFSTILYMVLILYYLDYFTAIRKKYFSPKVKSWFTFILDDFNQSFMKYLRLRTRIVLWLSLIYIITFIVLDMPGMILITVLIILLSYVPYLQYLALIPLAISCLVLSVENSQSFLLFFGIVAGVFVLASIIEELILNPGIMEKNIGMNPVIMILALSIWSYLMGLPGSLIGIPMTSLMIIMFKRYFLQSYQEVLQSE
jgi:predicted PurR-regulated permease PerM